MKAFLRESIELRLSFNEAKALISWLSDNTDDPTRDRAAISLTEELKTALNETKYNA